MLKILLEEKWKDDVPVFEFFSGAEAKRYHTLLKSAFTRADKSLVEGEAKLTVLDERGGQKGIHEYREIKTLKAGVKRNREKRDAAKFRIDKIEIAIKDWFAE